MTCPSPVPSIQTRRSRTYSTPNFQFPTSEAHGVEASALGVGSWILGIGCHTASSIHAGIDVEQLAVVGELRHLDFVRLRALVAMAVDHHRRPDGHQAFLDPGLLRAVRWRHRHVPDVTLSVLDLHRRVRTGKADTLRHGSGNLPRLVLVAAPPLVR